jgi:hypothetical protein
MNGFDILVPGEETLDRLPFRAYGRPCELLLTDRRLLVMGHTGALPVQLMLPRGRIAAGFPLARLDGFVLGRARRMMLLLLALTLAVAGGVMMIWPESIYFGLVAFAAAAVAFIAWASWPVTFFSIASEAFRFSGNTRLTEAQVFLERLELASDLCRRGLAPEQVREQVKLSGKLVAPEKGVPDASKEN